mmetsp:Transcript_33461/g.77746  ORF Transcript_33461/g.77746 Transcript_33461/m.77746 type:complete len:327 (+) Transcript_33461:78-1058(+)
MAQSADGRFLAQSSLYAEDKLIGGHGAVWGSFFDPKERSWGYACCRSTRRDAPCPLQKASPCSHGEVDDASAAEEHSEWRAAKLLDEVCSELLDPRSWYSCCEDYLSHFVRYWFGAWARGAPGAEQPGKRAVEQMRQALLPLVEQLKRRAVQQELLMKLAEFAELATESEYSKANDVYISITIGKALWHSCLDLGEQRAHWGGGLRTMQKQVVEKDHQNATLFDTNPEVQRYVHALKRLVTHMQLVQPSADSSKLGHAPAPAPDKSEMGLPVMRCIRDSDGGLPEPEYVEPSDPSYKNVASNRGLAFGHQAGHAHPFHGIGSARGV